MRRGLSSKFFDHLFIFEQRQRDLPATDQVVLHMHVI